MAIDLTREKLLTFNQAGQSLPGARRISYATWWRWWRHGIRGVKLETVVVGGRRYTSAAAVQRFVTATTAADSSAQSHARSNQQRQRDTRRADDALRLARILRGRSSGADG